MMFRDHLKKIYSWLLIFPAIIGCQPKPATVSSDIANAAGSETIKDISVSMDDVARMYYVLFTLQSDRYLSGAGNVIEIYKIQNRDDFVVQTTACKIVYNFPSAQTNSMATHYDYDGPNGGRCPTDSSDVPGLSESIAIKLPSLKKSWYIYQNLQRQRSQSSLMLLDDKIIPASIADLRQTSGSMEDKPSMTLDNILHVSVHAAPGEVNGDRLFINSRDVKDEDAINGKVNPCKGKAPNVNLPTKGDSELSDETRNMYYLNSGDVPAELAQQARDCAAASVPKSDVQASGAFGIH